MHIHEAGASAQICLSFFFTPGSDTEISEFMILFFPRQSERLTVKRSIAARLSLKGALLAVSLLVVSTVGCTVGPRYKRPTAQVPDTWKGEGPWQTAAPKDAIPKGAWWQVFHDADLDQLEQQLLQANQSLTASRDRLLEARSQARIVSAAFFPTVSTDPSGERQRVSQNRAFVGGELPPFTQSNFTVPFSVSYEVDLFGRVRRNLEAANASLQASAADLENVQLVLTAELAADYYNLRESDREIGVVRQSVEIQNSHRS